MQLTVLPVLEKCFLTVTSMVSDELSALTQICCFLIDSTSFLSDFFQDVFLVFSFQEFNYNVSWHGFLWFILFCIIQLLKSLGLYLLLNFGSFQLLFIWILFSHTSFLFPSGLQTASPTTDLLHNYLKSSLFIQSHSLCLRE